MLYCIHGDLQDVADRLGVTYGAVREHLANLYDRLGVTGAPQALWALAGDVIEPRLRA